ncbi:uncharacterized protein [Linepithema humile]|uniref:uncharacterized protein isoform X2 n=1 Tax=Linepithema humile TaxID=83485 RepID=UPI00351E899A
MEKNARLPSTEPTQQTINANNKKCKPFLSSYNSKFIIHYNWIKGRCKISKIYEIEQKRFIEHITSNKCLQMTKNTIWFCENRNLLAFNREKNGTIKKDKMIVGINDAFITSIAHCNDYTISGDVFGIIKHWRIESEKDKKIESKNNKRIYLKQSKIYQIDDTIDFINATSQHIIISSNNSIKILKYTDDKEGCTEENKIFCENDKSYVQSISFDPIGTKFAASSTDYCQFSSFLIYDIDKSYQVIDKKCDDYCCQLLWEDPHTILMCFQCSIKKIDLRTSEFVRTWDSFNYAPLTCCSSDNLYTFVTGSYTGVLWDQRQSVAIQTYTVEHGITLYNKGIDSLEFDNAHMYTATCNGLYELDFTGKNSFSDEGTGSESAEELD